VHPLTRLRHTDIKYKDDPITLSATASHSANAYKLRVSVTASMRPYRDHLPSHEFQSMLHRNVGTSPAVRSCHTVHDLSLGMKIRARSAKSSSPWSHRTSGIRKRSEFQLRGALHRHTALEAELLSAFLH
jgi:hypothetical protein